jgi:hypothetical protein
MMQFIACIDAVIYNATLATENFISLYEFQVKK